MNKITNALIYAAGALVVACLLWFAFSVWYAKYEICRSAGYNVIVCIAMANR
jgi:hypothetical protein